MPSRHLSIRAHSAEEKNLLGAQKNREVCWLPGSPSVSTSSAIRCNINKRLLIFFFSLVQPHTDFHNRHTWWSIIRVVYSHYLHCFQQCDQTAAHLVAVAHPNHYWEPSQSRHWHLGPNGIDLLTRFVLHKVSFYIKARSLSLWREVLSSKLPCSKVQSMSEAVALQKLFLTMWISSNARIWFSNFGSRAWIRICHEHNLL